MLFPSSGIFFFPIPDPLSAQVADSYLIFRTQLKGHFHPREASPVPPSSRQSWFPPGSFIPVSCVPGHQSVVRMMILVPLGALGVWGPCLCLRVSGTLSSPEVNCAGRSMLEAGLLLTCLLLLRFWSFSWYK